jgi:hypothetical protein
MTRLTTTVVAGVVALVGGAAACSKAPPITAETTAAGSTGTSTGASAPGGSSGASGAGGASSGPAKVVTAETDIAQYQSITIPSSNPNGAMVVSGPFFVTDMYAPTGNGFLAVVTSGSDCNAASPQNAALNLQGSPAQIHGIRMPVLKGQSLCAIEAPGATILGFAPY